MAVIDRETFLSSGNVMPLVAVDLIFVRKPGEVLLQLRNKPPAEGFWSVPGGRLFKNERIKDAVSRIADFEVELTDLVQSEKFQPQPLGCFEHFYDDAFNSRKYSSIHYLVLAHRIDVPSDYSLPGDDPAYQRFHWWPVPQALEHASVHGYTKDYLRLLQGSSDNTGFHISQTIAAENTTLDLSNSN